jgi:hypothetical protein
MSLKFLKQFIRRVRTENPQAVKHVYVFDHPASGVIETFSVGRKKSVSYVLRSIREHAQQDLFMLGAIAIEPSYEGGHLRFCTHVSVIPACDPENPYKLKIVELLSAIAAEVSKRECGVTLIAGRTWDAPPNTEVH